jgi:hypothetical protein
MDMELLTDILTKLHVAFGFTGLGLFWLPMVMKKGGKWHRLSGNAYVVAMWVVVATASLLSIRNVVVGNTDKAAFLGFIALITANPLWYGIAILKQKRQFSRAFLNMHLILDVAVFMYSVLLLVVGTVLQRQGVSLLMLVFGSLGLTVVPSILRRLRGVQADTDRIQGHIIGLMTTGIAAYTAFFVFGGYTWMQDLLPNNWGIVLWVAPGVVGGIGINYSVKYFKSKGLVKP